MEKRFITIQDAAKLLSLSVPTIKNQVKEGLIPSYKVGGRRLFDPDELVKWVKSKRDKRYKEPSKEGWYMSFHNENS